jgi:hypothetical protein
MPEWLPFIAAITIVLAVAARSPVTAGEPLVIGSETQVLVDDYIVESMNGLARRVNPLVKHPANPVIRPDQPWEEKSAVPISAFYDEDLKLYRMWYRPGPGKFNLGYNTSKDGIAWDKPALGLVDFKGSRENNQIALKTGPAWNGALKDLRETDPARRSRPGPVSTRRRIDRG